jgi:hypothetical protein
LFIIIIVVEQQQKDLSKHYCYQVILHNQGVSFDNLAYLFSLQLLDLAIERNNFYAFLLFC